MPEPSSEDVRRRPKFGFLVAGICLLVAGFTWMTFKVVNAKPETKKTIKKKHH